MSEILGSISFAGLFVLTIWVGARILDHFVSPVTNAVAYRVMSGTKLPPPPLPKKKINTVFLVYGWIICFVGFCVAPYI